jgi:uncharacterized MAPEG superfamily protein
MSATATAVAGFAGWFILLTVALATYRSALVLSGRKAANGFRSDGSDVGGLGQRLTRARDNVYENLPAFAALALAAWMQGRLDVTDPLAHTVLWARIGQSLTHIASISVPAIYVRFGFYLVQIAIWAWWATRLIG